MVNFKPPFKRISLVNGLEEALQKLDSKVHFPSDVSSEEFRLYLSKLCEQFKVDCPEPRSTPRLLDKVCLI